MMVDERKTISTGVIQNIEYGNYYEFRVNYIIFT